MKHTTTILAGIALASTLHAQGVKTTEDAYLAATPLADFEFEPIVTVGDRVPVTPGTAPEGVSDFAFCGIPDAMGIYKDKVSNQNILFVAHEISSSVHSRPFPGQARYKGAWVSRFVMSDDGGVISGSPAHSDLYLENTLQASTPPQEGDASAFTRFCSGSFAGTGHGMDRPLFLTNEESDGGTYDASGPQAVVIADGKMHTIPALGRVVRETTLIQPRRDSLTVIVSTEDGPTSPNTACSYIYMYVGAKQRRSSSVLDKNGLTGGKVYVLAGRDAQHNEGTFTSGSLPVKWMEIPDAASLTSAELTVAADALGAFGLVRVEDAEFDPTQPTRSMFFATTGGSGPNPLGRLYELTFNPTKPTAEGTLNVVYNSANQVYPGGTYSGTVGTLIAVNGGTGSLGTYSGGDINAGTDYPVSIDNIAVSKDFIVICEDRNSPADAIFSRYGRNGGVWTLDRNNSYAAKLQSTFNYAYTEARDNNTVGSNTRGRWETSGVIASDAIFGAGTFVINVQAHPQNDNYHRTTAPDGEGGVLTKAEAKTEFAEDGQVLIMRPSAN
jgi:hypothetical protein